MKKLMFAIGLGLISGSLYAACMGPYCYDDTGAAVRGTVGFQGAPYLTASNTVAGVNASTPSFSGQLILTTDGVSPVCISTGNSNCNQWVIIGATSTTGGSLTRCR